MMRKNLLKGGALLAMVVLLFTGCGEAKKAYGQGMEFANEGKYEKSLPYFEEAIKQDADQAEYYIGYGMALNRLNRYTEAENTLKKVAQHADKNNSKEDNKQIYYGMAIAEYGLGEYDSTIKYCDKAAKIEYFDDMNCDIWYTKLSAYWQQGKWEEAKKTGEKIIKENERYMEAYMALAEVENNLGNTEDAAKVYEKAIEVNKKYYDAYFKLYDQYLSIGQESDAEKVLDPLLVLKPSSAENMLVIGRAYLCKQEYDQAKKFLQMAYDGNSKESLYYLGKAAVAENAYDDAIESFQKYIKENKNSLNVDVYYQLALVYMKQDKYEDAQSMLTKGISYGSTNSAQALKKTQVILLEKQNHYKEAKKLAKEYITCYPSDTGMEKELAFIQTRIK